MPSSILDFFKPIRKDKRPREEAAVDLTNDNPSIAVATPPHSTADSNRSSNTDPNKLNPNDSAIAPRTKRQTTKRSAAVSEVPSSPATPVQTPEQPVGLSEYERKREAKMAENAKLLQQLGMTSAQLDMTRQLQQPRRTKAEQIKRRPKLNRKPVELQPVRRSRRLLGETAVGSARSQEGASHESDGSNPVEEDVSFTESNVLRYSVNGSETTRNAPPSSTLDSPDRELTGFQVDKQAYLYDHSLKKTYDIAFTNFHENGLVAAGGHGGQVSIFALSNSYHQQENVDDSDGHAPLMSFKAHSGWISAISLAKSIQGRANLLMTASNDASVKLWDLNHSSAMLRTPKEMFTSCIQHQKGIFGMDVCGDSVLTCSKDTSVVLSQFRGDTGSLEMIQRYEDHDGVVKCVRFAQDKPQLFASGGNDRKVRVNDARVAANPIVVVIGGVHSRAINSVQFHPTDDNLLLSAGFDPDFYLFDLRNASTPVCTFRKSPQSKDSKAIFHPIFVRNGQVVMAARGQDLLLYKSGDGSAISRGFIGDTATCIATDPFHDRITIAQGGFLRFADAQWDHKEV